MPTLTPEQQAINLGLSGLSCSCAQIVVHPVETTMVRQQIVPKGQLVPGFLPTMGGMAQAEGVHGLYRGITAALLREMSYSTLRFGLYEPLRDSMNDTPESNAKTPLGESGAGVVRILKRMLAGCTAGGLASAIASPTDLVKIRMQSDNALPIPGFWHYVNDIASGPKGPIMSFYEGVSATIARAVVLGATKMVVYNEVKDALKRSPNAPDPSKQPSSLQLLLPGTYGWKDGDWEKYGHACGPTTASRLLLVFNTSVCTGLAVTMTTSAFTNAKTQIMANPGKFKGTGDALAFIVRTHGVMGLYRGFAAQWARFGPYALVQFITWEQLRFLTGMPGI